MRERIPPLPFERKPPSWPVMTPVGSQGDAMVTVQYDDLSEAFAFVGSASPCEHSAYISLDTGHIYWTSELSPLEEEVPDDLETSARFLSIPHKTELDLGRHLYWNDRRPPRHSDGRPLLAWFHQSVPH
jgi:hypothetical protein